MTVSKSCTSRLYYTNLFIMSVYDGSSLHDQIYCPCWKYSWVIVLWCESTERIEIAVSLRTCWLCVSRSDKLFRACLDFLSFCFCMCSLSCTSRWHIAPSRYVVIIELSGQAMFDRHRPADDASMCREVVIAYLFSILCLTGNVDAAHAFEIILFRAVQTTNLRTNLGNTSVRPLRLTGNMQTTVYHSATFSHIDFRYPTLHRMMTLELARPLLKKSSCAACIMCRALVFHLDPAAPVPASAAVDLSSPLITAPLITSQLLITTHHNLSHTNSSQLHFSHLTHHSPTPHHNSSQLHF